MTPFSPTEIAWDGRTYEGWFVLSFNNLCRFLPGSTLRDDYYSIPDLLHKTLRSCYEEEGVTPVGCSDRKLDKTILDFFHEIDAALVACGSSCDEAQEKLQTWLDQRDDPTLSEAAYRAFGEYLSPIYAHLRNSGYSVHDLLG